MESENNYKNLLQYHNDCGRSLCQLLLVQFLELFFDGYKGHHVLRLLLLPELVKLVKQVTCGPIKINKNP